MNNDFIYLISSGVIGAVIAIAGLLKFLPQKIIEGLFGNLLERRLEKLKADNAQSLEAAKFELQWLADRGTRSNECEYQAVADAWEAFYDAHIETVSAVANVSQHPDLSTMTVDNLRLFLDENELHHTYQSAMLVAEPMNRNHIFGRHLRGSQIVRSSAALHTAQSVIRRQSVFMPPELYTLFEECLAPIRSALAEESVSANEERRGRMGFSHEAGLSLISQPGADNLERLRLEVRERLLRVQRKHPSIKTAN